MVVQHFTFVDMRQKSDCEGRKWKLPCFFRVDIKGRKTRNHISTKRYDLFPPTKKEENAFLLPRSRVAFPGFQANTKKRERDRRLALLAKSEAMKSEFMAPQS